MCDNDQCCNPYCESVPRSRVIRRTVSGCYVNHQSLDKLRCEAIAKLFAGYTIAVTFNPDLTESLFVPLYTSGKNFIGKSTDRCEIIQTGVTGESLMIGLARNPARIELICRTNLLINADVFSTVPTTPLPPEVDPNNCPIPP